MLSKAYLKRTLVMEAGLLLIDIVCLTSESADKAREIEMEHHLYTAIPYMCSVLHFCIDFSDTLVSREEEDDDDDDVVILSTRKPCVK